LVNHYSGPDASLPQHADNESSIHPDSAIHTLSLGSSCKVTFVDMATTQEANITCEHRSLYTMSRRSQDFYQHRIDPGATTEGFSRYSLTFRSVNQANKNSTCIIGDSNTCGINFGTGKGTFGYDMPGKQVFAPHIGDIDPLQCLAYNNIVVMCGINDIRSSDVKSMDAVKNLYHLLKRKIVQIQQLNPRACVFVCLTLPTKLGWLNQRGSFFNSLIKSDLLPGNFGVTAVNGFAQFLGPKLLLSERLAKNVNRFGDSDTLHLNGQGTGLLVQLIKQAINFRRYGGLYRPNRKNFNRDSGGSGGRTSSRRLSVGSSRDTRARRPVTDGYQPD